MLLPHHPSPRPRSPQRGRVLAAALAVLLAPALLCGCGSGPAVPTAPRAAAPPTAPTPASTGPTPPPAPAPAAPATGPGGSTTAPAPATTTPGGTPAATAPAATPHTGRPDTPRPTTAAPATGRPTTPAPPPPSAATALVRTTATGGRTVALTFDDGPGPATGQILDLLARYHARATFCQIGPNAAAAPATVRRIVAEGHRLCDHTVHHPQPMHTLPHDRQVAEITAAQDMITTAAGGAGGPIAWFRAPGGDFTAENEQIAAEHGMRSLSWSVDPRDWARPGAAAIVAAVQRGLRPGAVVLLHDGGGDRSQTVAALRQLLPWLVAQGYGFDLPAR
ncbi:polysaccharide deacetylase family protein [Kitasatospora sp. NPDC094015]|uniref:polysaccharide deacetylase family protein n=1 Tax=Kitasatospora sp. NPDC094015 TaxID=3155205 RepID=UPI00332588C5